MSVYLYDMAGTTVAFRRTWTDRHLFDLDGHRIGWFPWDDNDAVDLAGHYVSRLVAPDLQHVFEHIRAEYARTVDEVLWVTGRSELLEANPVLSRTLAVRNAYLAPLHYMQVALLERWRADRAAERQSDPAVARALLLTVNGIAAGMRNTG